MLFAWLLLHSTPFYRLELSERAVAGRFMPMFSTPLFRSHFTPASVRDPGVIGFATALFRSTVVCSTLAGLPAED